MKPQTISGPLLIESGIVLALVPVLAWLPASQDSARAGAERYLNVGLVSIVISLIACAASVILLTTGAILSFKRLPRWSSAWWVLIWVALAWVPIALLLLLGQLGMKSVSAAIVLSYAAMHWAFAVTVAACGLLLVWIVRTCARAFLCQFTALS